MALSISKVSGADYVAGNKKIRVRTVTFDSSYPTGGEPLTAADLGLKAVQQLIPHGPFRNTAGTANVAVSYDHTNAKLFAYTAAAETTAATDLSTYSGRVTAIGY